MTTGLVCSESHINAMIKAFSADYEPAISHESLKTEMQGT